MEIKVLQNAPQANTLDTGLEGPVPRESAGASAAPVLSGASVSVRGTTDFEKLLAELELQRDGQKEKIARGQFAAALAVLAGRQGGLSQTQQAAIASVASTSAALEQATAAVRTAAGDLDVASALLQAESERLARMIEAQKKTPEARLAEIQAEEKKDAARAVSEEAVAAAEEVVSDDVAVEAESDEIKAQRAKVAALQGDVAAKTEALETAKAGQASAEAALKGATAGLDRATQLVVTDAVRLAGKMVAAAAAEQPDGKPVEEKANAMVAALGDYADKIEEMRDDELAEKIAKTAVDILFLAEAQTLLTPSDLPGYEQKV